MNNYSLILEERYKEEKSHGDPEMSKRDFLGETVFDFTTYDSEVSTSFAEQMAEVIESILNKTTFEYQKENYITYLTMVNMPFLKDKLDWGTSIRGAWFDEYGHNKGEKYQIWHEWEIAKGEIRPFLKQLIDWSNP